MMPSLENAKPVFFCFVFCFLFFVFCFLFFVFCFLFFIFRSVISKSKISLARIFILFYVDSDRTGQG